MTKNGWKSLRNYPRKRYGSASAWILFTEKIFLHNFKWIRSAKKAKPFLLHSSPYLWQNRGGAFHPTQIGEEPPSRGRIWKAQVGLVAICTPFFTKYIPFYFFWWFFFCNVTKLYEFRNDTYFSSARLRILTDYVFTLFLAFEEVTKTHGLRKTPPFDFRHITEFSRIA